jgi:hypothetical protein
MIKGTLEMIEGVELTVRFFMGLAQTLVQEIPWQISLGIAILVVSWLLYTPVSLPNSASSKKRTSNGSIHHSVLGQCC